MSDAPKERCPWCGGVAHIVTTREESYGYYPEAIGAVCDDCGTIRGSSDVERWEQGIGTIDIRDEARAKAIAAWDTRVGLKKVERLRKLDAEAATYVESVIVLRTNFTGEEPHVGWKGLGLALSEALDERDAMRAEVERLRESNIRPLIWNGDDAHSTAVGISYRIEAYIRGGFVGLNGNRIVTEGPTKMAVKGKLEAIYANLISMSLTATKP